MKNVISTTNGGKRRYGENHWFWAVWIDMEDIKSREDREPVASGFSKTQKTAKWAAWTALKERVPEPEMWRAYRTNWAMSYLWSLEEKDERPLLSRCSVGKNRWQWVVIKDYSAFIEDEKPLATGIADSADAAQREAEEQCGSVRLESNWVARSYRTKQAAVKRSQKTTTNQDTSAVEFVYKCYGDYSDYDGKAYDVIDKHRIVKRTKKRIYVEKEDFRDTVVLEGNWRDFVQSTFVLDRCEFETTGKAERRSRGWWGRQNYYADPSIYFAEPASAARPESFVILDVPADATGVQITAAYRKLATKTHPDVGGNAEEFKRIHCAFEQAMKIVGVTVA